MSENMSLRLSAFEELFLRLDHKDGPSNFFFKFELNSRLRREQAQVAIDQVSELHPLARCKAEYDAKGRPHWGFCPRPLIIEWFEQGFSDVGYPDSYFDPTQNRPLRVLCFPRGESATTMLFQVHHVAFDGLGFLQLFEDWLSLYRDPSAAIRSYDPKKLEKRCRPNNSLGQTLRLMPGQWRSVRATILVLGRAVIPFLPKRAEVDSANEVVQKVATKTLSSDATQSLRNFARQNSVSTNTVLVRNLFVSIQRWQSENGIPVSGSHYRLVIPFNERREKHQAMSACNHCTIINIDRSTQEISAPEEMLVQIDQDIKLIKHWRLSLNFWRVLKLFQWLPGGLAKHTSTERVTATTLFTNLGRLDRSLKIFSSPRDHDLTVTDLEIVPTMQRGMTLSIATYEYRDQIRITMQYDSNELSETQANDFLDTFIDDSTNPINPQKMGG